ncbi:pyruvate, phosphate dikinase [Natronoglycomyces albus]|uniref:Pyruvate, phosphate dikinase n=1 Tax=Natronoglycomyces albus TaxID=2811108 RepID=A0A895XST1_9ACTN|nr:pyruvate, phosphate dikinase [Natronoglycomyces albus]QSB06305.1 pyruvate, phosphate dikinase [Natronoglycomyces albus]
MTTYVYDFASGDAGMRDLLGGKGANLAEMTRLGLPVPPGFTITTEACRHYLQSGGLPPELTDEVHEHLKAVESAMGRRLGDKDDPLLVSVRSGAKFSMPGMMDTVLNIGLNDESVVGLARQSGDDRFAADTYRRLIQMFAKTVQGLDPQPFDAAIDAIKAEAGAATESQLSTEHMWKLVDRFKDLVLTGTGKPFPQQPSEQLWQATEAVFRSWNSERAELYRRREGIASDLGTAVNIVAMVFGNLGEDSGTGVAFTRDPATGAQGIYGDYLTGAQGEDVVAGTHNTVALTELEKIDKASYDKLLAIMETLENHYRDVCDIEFTIERGTLWMLQTRVGKRTAAAAFTIASDLVDDGLISLDEAVGRVSGEQLSQLMFPTFDGENLPAPLVRGIPASPGAAVGTAVFSAERAIEKAQAGQDVILIRRETNPDDLGGMIAAAGILTARGGKTSHAAVVARGMGKTCVCGVEALQVLADHAITADGHTIREGDEISIDGSTGAVWAGRIDVCPSPVARYFTKELPADADRLIRAVDRLMRHADASSRLHVWANADTGADAERAREFGAVGIGLCRTEHMFLGERRQLVERLVLANEEGQKAVLDQLLELQRGDFTEILRAMDGLPVVIRLLDPPLHEFLPSIIDLSIAQATEPTTENEKLLTAVKRLHEHNPMLGLRGVRLGLVIKGLYEMQVSAIAQAALALKQEGLDPRPEIMIPLVADVTELHLSATSARAILNEHGVLAPVGTMIEVPRAALTAGDIATEADFFSFGTNDLTQMTWGFSRDDVEGSFFGKYQELGVFDTSPFATLDTSGVGQLVSQAVKAGRAAQPELHLGVCGEHGGDPESIQFFHAAGLDYVSCSPFRVPVARLAAGQAALADKGGEKSDSR